MTLDNNIEVASGFSGNSSNTVIDNFYRQFDDYSNMDWGAATEGLTQAVGTIGGLFAQRKANKRATADAKKQAAEAKKQDALIKQQQILAAARARAASDNTGLYVGLAVGGVLLIAGTTALIIYLRK